MIRRRPKQGEKPVKVPGRRSRYSNRRGLKPRRSSRRTGGLRGTSLRTHDRLRGPGLRSNEPFVLPAGTVLTAPHKTGVRAFAATCARAQAEHQY
jgi:hypothetical protein